MSKVFKAIATVAGIASIVLAPFNPVAAAIAGAISAYAPPGDAALAKPPRRTDMTLMNGLVHDGTGYLYSDTQVWDTETMEPIGQTGGKAFHGTLWPWAAVHTGIIDGRKGLTVPTGLADRCSLSAKRLLDDAIDVLRIEREEGRIGRLLIAFADEQYGARMFIIANDDVPYAPPLEPYETIEFKCSGNGEPWAAEFADLDMTPADMERFIEHQIDTPFEVLPGLRITGVGGTIFETKVSMAGVSSRVLRTVGPLEERATA